MSRYHEGDWDEEFRNQGAFWTANARRALKGRRGKQALRDLREALLHLPEKRLISSALCTVDPERRRPATPDPDAPLYMGGKWAVERYDRMVEEQGEGVCAMGALLWWARVKAGADAAEAFDALPTLDGENHDLAETAVLARDVLGLTYYLGWELAYRNDETYGHLTPERRYTAFMAWIDGELSESVA